MVIHIIYQCPLFEALQCFGQIEGFKMQTFEEALGHHVASIYLILSAFIGIEHFIAFVEDSVRKVKAIQAALCVRLCIIVGLSSKIANSCQVLSSHLHFNRQLLYGILLTLGQRINETSQAAYWSLVVIGYPGIYSTIDIEHRQLVVIDCIRFEPCKRHKVDAVALQIVGRWQQLLHARSKDGTYFLACLWLDDGIITHLPY